MTHVPSGLMDCALAALGWWVGGRRQFQICLNFFAPRCIVHNSFVTFKPSIFPHGATVVTKFMGFHAPSFTTSFFGQPNLPLSADVNYRRPLIHIHSSPSLSQPSRLPSSTADDKWKLADPSIPSLNLPQMEGRWMESMRMDHVRLENSKQRNWTK